MTEQQLCEAKELFERNGYFVSPPLLDVETVERLTNALDAVRSGHYESGISPVIKGWNLNRITDPVVLATGGLRDLVDKQDNCFLSNGAIREVATNPTIAGIAGELLGAAKLRLWQDKYFFKPEKAETCLNTIDWHQDFHTWRAVDRPQMLSAWIPLQDVSEENGTLIVIPGSHKWGWDEAFNNFANFDVAAQEERIRARRIEESNLSPVPLVARAGQVIFHHCLTLHRSDRNTSALPRRAYVIAYQNAECCWNAEPATEHLHFSSAEMRRQGRMPGQTFEGPMWPEVWHR